MGLLRILYASHDGELTGAEKCLLTLLRNIDRSWIDPLVILPVRGPLTRELEKLSIDYEILPMPWWLRHKGATDLARAIGIQNHIDLAVKDVSEVLNLSHSILNERLASIVRLIKLFNIDIVQTNGVVSLEAALAARMAGVKHIWHIHEYIDGHPSLVPFMPLEAIGWYLDNLSDLVVVPSEHLRESYRCRVRLEKLHKIYHGVEIENFNECSSQGRDQLRSAVRREFGIGDSECLICSVGASWPRKGMDRSGKGSRGVMYLERRDFRFLVIGHFVPYDPRFMTLKKLIKELRLQDVVCFTGFRRDVTRIVAASDIVFQPSRMESFSLVAAEAMGLSVPVVGTRCGGMEEVVLADHTGLMTLPGDYEAMAKALGFLIDNPDERVRLGRNGQRLFLSKFSPTRYAEDFASVYRNVMRIRRKKKRDMIVSVGTNLKYLHLPSFTLLFWALVYGLSVNL